MELSNSGQASYDLQRSRLSQAAESLARRAQSEGRRGAARASQGEGGAQPAGAFQELLGRASSGQVREGELRKYFPGLLNAQQGGVSSARIEAQSREQILAEIESDSEKERLYEAAKDFQTLFVKQMLSAMRKNLNPENDPLDGGFRQRIYEDMLYDEYAQQWSEQGDFDLADQIYRQMSPYVGASNERGAAAQRAYDANSNRAPGATTSAEQRAGDSGAGQSADGAEGRISTSDRYNADDWRP